MKKLNCTYATMAALFLTAMAVFGQEPAEAPSYKDGDFWQFRVGRALYEVLYSEGKLKFFELKPEQKIEVEADPPEDLQKMLAVEQDEREYLQFPLFVGKQWSASFGTGRTRTKAKKGTIQIRANAETRVTGAEEITLQAGTLRVLKIEREELPTRGRGRTATVVYYYSPQTRSIVKYLFTDEAGRHKEIELVKFGAAR